MLEDIWDFKCGRDYSSFNKIQDTIFIKKILICKHYYQMALHHYKVDHVSLELGTVVVQRAYMQMIPGSIPLITNKELSSAKKDRKE